MELPIGRLNVLPEAPSLGDGAAGSTFSGHQKGMVRMGNMDDAPVVVRFVVTAVIDPERYAQEYGDEVETVRERVGEDVAVQLMDIVSADSTVGGLNYFAHWLKTRTQPVWPSEEMALLLSDYRQLQADFARAEELKGQERFDEGDGLEDDTARKAAEMLDFVIDELFGGVA